LNFAFFRSNCRR